MAVPKLLLREPTAKGKTLIFLVFRIGNDRLKYSTGESIEPQYWNTETQTANEAIKGNKQLSEQLKSINLQLSRYKNKVAEIESFWTVQKIEPTIEALKDELDKEFKIEPATRKNDLFGFIETFIENVKFTRGTNPKPISPKTKTKYRITLKILKDFAEKKRRGKLDFKNIDMDFYFEFIDFLQKQYKHTPNTIGKNVKVLKLFLREATEAGLKTNPTFENRKFAAMSEDVSHIYLNENELDLLWNLDLSNNSRLETVRDLFLIGCHTALRFSDFTNIKPQNIIETTGGRAIKIQTQKTSQTVFIPLHWRVEVILAKYDNQLPRAISNQKMNDYLKEVGKLAGIDTQIETSKTKAGLKFTSLQPKYELITTHTARRSAATNMFKAGIPSISIMRITGHKTESVFLKYINFSDEENAILIMNHDFFTKGRMRAI